MSTSGGVTLKRRSCGHHLFFPIKIVPLIIITITTQPVFASLAGYGFVDFDSPAAAQKAVTALKSSGVQAQMAKVRSRPAVTVRVRATDTRPNTVPSPLSAKQIDYLTACW